MITMPTNEERQEVAGRLRSEKESSGLFDNAFLELFRDVIGRYPDMNLSRGKCETELLFKRLADLIDPICEVHRDTVFRPAVLYPDRELDDVGREETVFRCGKCCEIVSYDEDYNPETDSPAYCETCGSRIIGIGEPWDE